MRRVMKTCAFTGNRPDKLPWGYDENDARCRRVKREIYLAAKQAVNDGYNRFICGMAQGGDTYFAEAVLALKAEYDVTLECAVPYRRQSLSWSDAAKSVTNAFWRLRIKLRFSKNIILRGVITGVTAIWWTARSV